MRPTAMVASAPPSAPASDRSSRGALAGLALVGLVLLVLVVARPAASVGLPSAALLLAAGAWLLVRLVRAQRALATALDEAATLALLDALTRLGNRRAFDLGLRRELARAERAGEPLSLLVADLDRFKAINDQHGHPAGDQILRAVADTLVEVVRRPDTCFRWGGDEFAVLLPGATQGAARRVVRRIASAVERGVGAPDGEPITLTAGVAQARPGEPPEAVMAGADRDLLANKAGRPSAEVSAARL